MDRIVECIPNFSEGRDEAKVDELVAAIRAVPGVVVLGRELDADHHRSVITFAGEPEAALEAAVRVAGRAVELIDLGQHSGEHPRMGAIDVLPFVPIKGVSMEDCVRLARRAGERIARELRLPVFLYERAATRPDRVNLADVRRGEFEGLREEIGTNPDRRPDFGEPRAHPTAGAVAVGARPPLIAYNVNLSTDDLGVAKRVARAVRGRDGGLQYVKALGFEIRDRGQVQVSMNLVNYEATPIFRAFEMVRREAERYGVAVAGSEIVGLVPQAALDACGDYYLRLENFSADQILERRLQAALAEVPPAADQRLGTFAAEVAAGTPAPGGGSVAAYAGALAAALGEMVCRLTIGKKKFAAVEAEAGAILAQCEQLGAALRRAVAEDAESFARVIEAMRLPKESEAERLARAAAIEQATKGAVAVPRRVAGTAMEVLELLDELAGIGNPNSLSDLAVGAQLALAAMRGAAYNVFVNLGSAEDEELNELLARGQEIADGIESQLMKGMAPR
ncbi:MAG TPA: glutamate formimidoyltransferase [Blastocatellia bacterium]|nr:glutamate formimidoyltransferase [Blastocatellia bacterium]